MGGDGPKTFDRVIEFGNGWMPISRPGQNPVAKIPELRQRAERAGRDPKSISIGIFFAKPDKAALDGLRTAGVNRAIFGLPSEGRDAILPKLDAYAQLIHSGAALGTNLPGRAPSSTAASARALSCRGPTGSRSFAAIGSAAR